MGMFNYVKFEMRCPTCGTTMRDFQTKDGDYLYLDTVEPLSVDRFYSYCRKCGTWVEYYRKRQLPLSLEEYEVTIKPNEVKIGEDAKSVTEYPATEKRN